MDPFNGVWHTGVAMIGVAMIGVAMIGVAMIDGGGQLDIVGYPEVLVSVPVAPAGHLLFMSLIAADVDELLLP